MRYDKEKIYELLPAIYRQRDIEEGKPLEDLLGVIAEQVEILEEDIEGLYNNWFIETCEPWVVPYIGDLVGAAIQHQGSDGTINQRAFVANTINYRRRKGTLSMLEQLARDVTGWNARAVEFFKLLITTQYLNHLRLSNLGTPNLRKIEALDLLNTPFDTISHTVDVRRISKGHGYYNIPNIGIFLWRLQAYPVVEALASKKEDSQGMFFFSQLGRKMQLFNHPVTEISPEHIAEEINVAVPIRRLALENNMGEYYASEGENKSIKITVNGLVRSHNDIVVCDLSEWNHRPDPPKIAIDPVLGLIVFSAEEDPKSVHVSYYYGFSSEIGGGFYPRPDSSLRSDRRYQISKKSSLSSINDAIGQWKIDKHGPATFEITDSEFYDETLELELPAGSTIEIRSKQEQRPVLRGSITVTAVVADETDERSCLILDGLMIDGSIIIDNGDLGALTLKHCTLVPKATTSLRLKNNDYCSVTLESTITGRIDAELSEAKINMKDSIVDGGGNHAVKCYDLTAEDSTVFGCVEVDMIRLASNTIFTDMIKTKRRQVGCVRFCYVPPGSRVPRRYCCQPENALNSSEDKELKPSTEVSPRFTSMQYGDPGYAQLSEYTPSEILRGSDNESEMGVFNHLQQAHRINGLKSCLDEYLRFGLEAGIIFES